MTAGSPAPALSVCVPTHHGRAREIEDLIESFQRQVGSELAGRIELCISDGASRDDTAGVAERATRDGRLAVRYRRSDPDRGFMAHQRESVEMANAPYCWLMSSDDAAADGGLRTVLEALRRNPGVDGVSLGFDVADRRMEELIVDPVQRTILPPDPERPRRYSTREQALDELGVHFVSFSAQVVSRDAWLAATRRRLDRGPLSDLFGHMQVLGEMLAGDVAWAWCPDRAMLMRHDNDSWRPEKFGNEIVLYWRRVLTEIAKVYAELWGGRRSPGYRSCMSRWRSIALTPPTLVMMKLQEEPPPSLRRDLAMMATFSRLFAYDRDYWRAALPLILVPHFVVAREPGRWQT